MATETLTKYDVFMAVLDQAERHNEEGDWVELSNDIDCLRWLVESVASQYKRA